MSWVNLDDVYVNKTGDTIAGNLSVGGALTINDGKGTDTTYNVANEITTLRDSVSQAPIEVAKTSGSTSYESFKVDLPITKMGCLIVVYYNRPLCSTVFPISHFIKYNTNASDCVDCYYVSASNLHATAYYQNGYLYLQSGDKAVRASFVVF